MARKEIHADTPCETWWKVTHWRSMPGDMIVPVRVIRETTNYVFLAEPGWMDPTKLFEVRREKGGYFKSYTQAREHLIEVAEDERAEARTAMNTAEAMVQRAHDLPMEAPHVAW